MWQLSQYSRNRHFISKFLQKQQQHTHAFPFHLSHFRLSLEYKVGAATRAWRAASVQCPAGVLRHPTTATFFPADVRAVKCLPVSPAPMGKSIYCFGISLSITNDIHLFRSIALAVGGGNRDDLPQIFPMIDNDLNVLGSHFNYDQLAASINAESPARIPPISKDATLDISGDLTPCSDWEFNTNDATKGSTNTANDLVRLRTVKNNRVIDVRMHFVRT